MLYNGVYSKDREELVKEFRDFITVKALEYNCDVIVDDTNFNPEHRMVLESIAFRHKAELEIKDFTDVPLEVCLERNAKRENPVPEEAIRRMHAQYIAKEPQHD